MRKHKVIKRLFNLYMWPLKNKAIYNYCNYTFFYGGGIENFKKAVDLAKKYVEDGDIILDIGASQGLEHDSTQTFSKAFVNNMIYAFEPIKDVYNTLINNTKGIENIKCFNLALSNYCRKEKIQITENSGSSSLLKLDAQESKKIGIEEIMNVIGVEEVQVTTIERFIENECPNSKIALLKLDIQGAELDALKGAGSYLDKTKIVLVEMHNNDIYENGCKYYEIDDFMRANNFTLFYNICDETDYNRHIDWDTIYISNKLL